MKFNHKSYYRLDTESGAVWVVRSIYQNAGYNWRSIARKYRQLLEIKQEDSIELAKFTEGYAYAYQVLGEICFNQKKSAIDDEITEEFDDTIGSQYDLLWNSMIES